MLSKMSSIQPKIIRHAKGNKKVQPMVVWGGNGQWKLILSAPNV